MTRLPAKRSLQLMARTPGSSVYTKLPARPGEDAMALMRTLRPLAH